MNGNPVGELTTAVSSGISGSNRQGSELRLGSTGTGNALAGGVGVGTPSTTVATAIAAATREQAKNFMLDIGINK